MLNLVPGKGKLSSIGLVQAMKLEKRKMRRQDAAAGSNTGVASYKTVPHRSSSRMPLGL